MIKKLIILRSIPGGGKSHLAQEIKETYENQGSTVEICSADDFHMERQPDGTVKYNWKPDRVSEAHGWCQNKAAAAMREGKNIVVIDNTNTTARETQFYVEAAIVHDYEIEFKEPQTPWWHRVKPILDRKYKSEKDVKPFAKVFAERNVHGVPENTIIKMMLRWQPNLTVEEVLKN